MDVQHHFFSLAQIAPPHHPISPARLPTTISPAAISIQSEPPLISVSDVDMDSDSDPSSGSDIDDDEDVDDSYKERSRGTRTGLAASSKSQRGSGAGSAQRRPSKADSQSSGTANSLSTNGKKSSGKASGSSGDAGPTGATPAPKKRGNGRITVAEFVPPDVTGLSKREARLVKNRAAAFLSRQRKREEFETMEACVFSLALHLSLFQ
jgi:hypothetical protein